MISVIMATGCEQPPPPDPANVPFTAWREVGKWTGTTSMQSETFAIDRFQWRIDWTTKNEKSPGAGRFTLNVHSADSGRILSTPVQRTGVGSDFVLITEDPRRFYLSFEASDLEWTVIVEEPVIAERKVAR
jgi:hypothetical protein